MPWNVIFPVLKKKGFSIVDRAACVERDSKFPKEAKILVTVCVPHPTHSQR